MARHLIELTKRFMGPPRQASGVSMCCENLDPSSVISAIPTPHFSTRPPLLPSFIPFFFYHTYFFRQELFLFLLSPTFIRGPSSAIIFQHEYDPRPKTPFCSSTSILTPRQGSFADFPPIPNRRPVDPILFPHHPPNSQCSLMSWARLYPNSFNTNSTLSLALLP